MLMCDYRIRDIGGVGDSLGGAVASVAVIASTEQIARDADRIIEVLRRHSARWNR